MHPTKHRLVEFEDNKDEEEDDEDDDDDDDNSNDDDDNDDNGNNIDNDDNDDYQENYEDRRKRLNNDEPTSWDDALNFRASSGRRVTARNSRAGEEDWTKRKKQNRTSKAEEAEECECGKRRRAKEKWSDYKRGLELQ